MSNLSLKSKDSTISKHQPTKFINTRVILIRHLPSTMVDSTGFPRQRRAFFHRLHSYHEPDHRETYCCSGNGDLIHGRIPVRKISEPSRLSPQESSKPSRKISEPGRRPNVTVLYSPPIATGIWNWYSKLSSSVKRNLQSPKFGKKFRLPVVDPFLEKVNISDL
ncbi:hypothetical protein GWI33_013507, partial [Rhynchophorus ferrugineus]